MLTIRVIGEEGEIFAGESGKVWGKSKHQAGRHLIAVMMMIFNDIEKQDHEDDDDKYDHDDDEDKYDHEDDDDKYDHDHGEKKQIRGIMAASSKQSLEYKMMTLMISIT